MTMARNIEDEIGGVDQVVNQLLQLAIHNLNDLHTEPNITQTFLTIQPKFTKNYNQPNIFQNFPITRSDYHL